MKIGGRGGERNPEDRKHLGLAHAKDGFPSGVETATGNVDSLSMTAIWASENSV